MSTMSMPPCWVTISTRGGKSALLAVVPALAAPFLLVLVGLDIALRVFIVAEILGLALGAARLAEERVPELLALALSSWIDTATRFCRHKMKWNVRN